MKKSLEIVFAVVLCIYSTGSTLAFEGYYTHVWTPYPPGCVYTLTLPYDLDSQGQDQTLVSETVMLGAPDNSSPAVPVEIKVIRRACAEEGRSALFMRINGPEGIPYKSPKTSARIGADSYSLRLSREPNTRFEDYATKTLDGRIWFVIDGAAFGSLENAISAEQYNGAFELIVEDTGTTGNIYEYHLAENNSALKPEWKPLTGRMSGTWVAEGTTDQGFQLSIQELWTNETPRPHAFLSWFTFDKDGHPLWLTGTGTFNPMSTDRLFLEMELVTNGEFLGSKKADRQVLLPAQLVVENCNRLRFNYHLMALGLGAGTVYLKRPFSLETAGYACRDTQSRIDALSE